MVKTIKHALLLLIMWSPGFALAADLVQESRDAQQVQDASDSEREARFENQQNALQTKLNALLAERAALEAQTDVYSQTLSANEQQLAELEQQRRLETGSLGDVFDVVRQAASDIQAKRVDAPASALQPEMDKALQAIHDQRALPSLATLSTFIQGLDLMLENSALVEDIDLTVRDSNGELSSKAVTRLGDMMLADEFGYLEWDSERQQANRLPAISAASINLTHDAALMPGESLTLDPSRGALIMLEAQTPGLVQRIAQGGVVGAVIGLLLLVGLGISVVRAGTLFSVGKAMKAQAKTSQTPGNNPLGRVLNVYHAEPDRSLETLELRLMEAVMDEQEQFEKGLSMLKLLAALAPMLGLLGTVTGMIETFQVITEFGSGDPAIMAGGISTALVTTVMGLVAAIPLLLAHNILSSKADALRGMLEKTGIGLIAEQAEAAQSAAGGRA